jgi:hypothetical protein
MMLAVTTSYANQCAHIYIMKGLYFANTHLVRKSINNQHIFTFEWIFIAFMFNKVASVSSSRTFFQNGKK